MLRVVENEVGEEDEVEGGYGGEGFEEGCGGAAPGEAL